MRYHSRAPTLLSLLFTLLHHTASSPIPDPVPALTCGQGQESCGTICCATDQTCQVSNQCVAKGSVNVNTEGTWRYITTTIVETGPVTRTTTYSTLIPAATVTGITPTYTSWTPPEITTTINPSGRSSGYITFSNTFSITGSFAPPGRPTESFNGGVIGGDISGSKILVPTVTGTNTFLVPAPTGSLGFGGVVGGNTGSGSLTGAQIGGIVGGVLGALFLIALILLCCCMKKGFKGFFGWLNGGSRRHDTTIIHEHEHEHGRISHGGHHGSTHHHVGGGLGAGAGAAAGAGFLGGMLSRIPGRRVTTTHTHEHHTLHGHQGSHHGGGVVHGGAGSHHFQSGHHGVIGGGGGGASHRPSGHGGVGFAALLGGAAAGLASVFSRKKHRVSEKYSSTSYSDESYSETGSSESSTESSSSSSDSSSDSSSSSD